MLISSSRLATVLLDALVVSSADGLATPVAGKPCGLHDAARRLVKETDFTKHP